MRPWNPSDDLLEKAWDYVSGHIAQTGYPPNLREMAAALGYTSVSSAQALIAGMENKGWIERSQDKRRLIRLTREDA